MNKECPEANCNDVDALLALRGIACLAVVFHHCNPPRNSIVYHGYDLSWIICSPGGIAVWIFFCLSGYLMGKAFYTNRYDINLSGVVNFWRNRILRIAPLYYFAVVILALFVYTDILKIENWGYLLRIVMFTYNHALPPAWNGAFWSLSTEFQFYLVIPFIYSYLFKYLVSKKNILFAAFLTIFFIFLIKLFLWMLFRYQLTESQGFGIKYWYTPLLMNMDLFLSGFFVSSFINLPHKKTSVSRAVNVKTNFTSPKLIKLIAIVLILALYFFAAHHIYTQELFGLPERSGKGIRTSMTFFILQPLTALITSFFIFAFESNTYPFSKRVEKVSFGNILKNPVKLLEILGNLSYGIYLWHLPIITKITPIITATIPLDVFYVKSTYVIFCSTLLAAITYYLVEIPFSRLKIVSNF